MRTTVAAAAAITIVLAGASWASAARAGGPPPATVPADSAADAADAKESSRAAFRRGVAQYENGNYEAARDSFEEAYRLFPHPSILYNLGLALWKTKRYRGAETELLKFLEDDGGAPPADVADARSVLSQVRQHLGTFLLRVAPIGARARLDDGELALLPGKFVEVRTTVGSHALHVEADGYAPMETSVDVATNGTQPVDLALERGGGGAGVPADGRAILGWSLAGGAVVAAGVSLVNALRAKSLADDYNTPNSGHFQDPSTRSSGITFRTTADVAGAVALVAAGFGVYLLLTPTRPVAASAGVLLSPAYAGVRGAF